MILRRIQQPDTPADVSLRECLHVSAKRSFIVVAGAGSGKTTSLVKALATLVKEYGPALKRNRSGLHASPILKLLLPRYRLMWGAIRSFTCQQSTASSGCSSAASKRMSGHGLIVALVRSWR
jgi:hypothetical protein